MSPSPRTRAAGGTRRTAGCILPLCGALIVGFSFPMPAFGQAAAQGADTVRLVGIVVDARSEGGVPGAFVAVAGEDQGVMTDAEGRFRGLHAPMGPVVLQVQALGYGAELITVSVERSTDAVVLELEPDPIVLEGVEVMHDRLQSRRNAVGVSVRTYDEERLARSGSADVLDFLRQESTLWVAGCQDDVSAAGGFEPLEHCAWVRGREVRPTVYIDEIPVPQGLDQLLTYRPWELHLIEVYQGGRHIRAYTHQFMERVAERPMALLPILLF